MKSHGHQNLEQRELLLGDPIHQGWAGGVALGPLAGVHQVKRTSFGRGLVVTGRLQTPVPAVQGLWQRRASNLEAQPVAGTMREVGDCKHQNRG